MPRARSASSKSSSIRKPDREFDAANRELQKQLVASHEKRQEVKLVPYAEALAKRFQTDWATVDIPKPEFIGTRVLENVPLDDAPRVHRLVAVLSDVGAQGQVPADSSTIRSSAKPLANCSTMPTNCSTGSSTRSLLTARGVYGFWPAASEGDDIIVYCR